MERGAVVEDDNLTAQLNEENREESSRLDRDLELDIEFPNPAINEIGSQLDGGEGTEWTFKEVRREKKKETTTVKPEEKEATTIQSSIYRTQFGVPFRLQLPPLPTIRSLNSVWTVLNNLNDVIYECEWKFNCFFLCYLYHLKVSFSFSH